MNRKSAPRRLSRRELLFLGAALGTCGMCGVASTGGLAGFLLLRRQKMAAPVEPTYSPTPPVTSTPEPPPIVPRPAWNARPINPNAANEHGVASASNPYGWYVYEGNLAQIYRTVVMHHSYPIPRDTGTMREIQDLHMDGDHWADVGYHYGINGNGTIYEGRDIHVRGASVAGYNSGTIGIVLIGDFQVETPSAAQITAFTRLTLWLKTLYNVTHLAGHFEFNPQTVCPGPNAKPYLDAIAQASGLARGTGGYIAPTPFPTETRHARDCCQRYTVGFPGRSS